MLGMLYCSHALVAQQFTAIYNADSTLTGFTNSTSRVSLAPQFVSVGGNKWQDVVAVMKEDKQGKWHGYYLFSSMKKAGADSLYMSDNTFDCESEGFIRFTDYKTDRTGLFNRNGKIVVPAVYNYISMLTNSMLITLQDANKVQDGEHFFYDGGRVSLIDTSNKILVKDFSKAENLNLYSVKVEDQPSSDTTRMSFKGENGKYYTFQVYKKEFSQWLHRDLLPGLTKEKLAAHSFEKITWWDGENWIYDDKTAFIDKHWDFLQARLKDVAAFNFVRGSFNPFLFEGPQYSRYMNNCFEAKDWQYPMWSIFWGGSNEKGQLDFLRTDEGYKLLMVGFGR